MSSFIWKMNDTGQQKRLGSYWTSDECWTTYSPVFICFIKYIWLNALYSCKYIGSSMTLSKTIVCWQFSLTPKSLFFQLQGVALKRNLKPWIESPLPSSVLLVKSVTMLLFLLLLCKLCRTCTDWASVTMHIWSCTWTWYLYWGLDQRN